jgi:hypothetical protein
MEMDQRKKSLHLETAAITSLISIRKSIQETIKNIESRRSFIVDMFVNLANSAIDEIESITQSANNLTLVSINTRNIFELYLILLHIYDNPENQMKWMGQMSTDHRDVINGFCELFDRSPVETKILQDSLSELESLFKKTDMIAGRGFNIRELAENQQLLPDYLAIYKLCSKLAHPTSYKVNGRDAISFANQNQAILKHAAGYFANRFRLKLEEILSPESINEYFML